MLLLNCLKNRNGPVKGCFSSQRVMKLNTLRYADGLPLSNPKLRGVPQFRRGENASRGITPEFY